VYSRTNTHSHSLTLSLSLTHTHTHTHSREFTARLSRMIADKAISYDLDADYASDTHAPGSIGSSATGDMVPHRVVVLTSGTWPVRTPAHACEACIHACLALALSSSLPRFSFAYCHACLPCFSSCLWRCHAQCCGGLSCACVSVFINRFITDV
jgi:hypothetical protein